MGIFLGNLTIDQIEERFEFKFTDDERARLKELHHPNAEFADGEIGWHMFDMPEFLAFSKGNVGHEVLKIFQNHNDEFNHAFQAGYANSHE